MKDKQGSSIQSVDSSKDQIQIYNEIVKSILNKYGSNIKIIYDKPMRSKILANADNIVEVALFLRNNYGLDHAESASGTDYPHDNEIEINYHLGSYSNQDLLPYIMNLSVRIKRDDPKSISLIEVFPSVEYHERETYEMLGVYFVGHPRNERFLLPEDWADIPPLRKDFRIKGR